MKRRNFIHALGGLGAAALLPSCASVSRAEQPWIDTHHHFFAPEYQKAWIEWTSAHKVPVFPAQRAWTRQAT